MNRNLDEFLQQAARRRAQNVPPRVQPADPEVLEIVDADLVDHNVTGADVASHVEQHLDASSFEERASHLGEVAGKAAAKATSHTEDVFDHRVGRLSESSESVEPMEAERIIPIGSLQELFSSPEKLKQAVILSEIFKRPDDW